MMTDFSKLAAPKTTLSKDKLQPFGAHHLTRLDKANNKLTCSLSAAHSSDHITDAVIVAVR